MINTYLDDYDLENFIRSHPNLTQINTRRVKKHGKMYEINRNREDVIVINYTNIFLIYNHIFISGQIYDLSGIFSDLASMLYLFYL